MKNDLEVIRYALEENTKMYQDGEPFAPMFTPQRLDDIAVAILTALQVHNLAKDPE